MVDTYFDANDVGIGYNDAMSPTEYEHMYAEILRGQGWDARVTQGSGDQGVDVLAEKGGITIAVQCKKYSSPVGNKAVQEVIAGRGFNSAQYGIVVTNNSYTPSARKLAGSQSVLLLHHEDLLSINELLDGCKKLN